ncbi:MAG: carbohydrate-binding family V/XII [Terrimicrobiaceae bacterium]
MKALPAVLWLILALLFSSVLSAAGDGWPKTFSSGGIAFTVYQPQVTSWSGNTLTSRLAVSVIPQGAAAPIFGTLVLTATTDVDNEAQTVSLSRIAPLQTNFPSAPDQASNFAALICIQAAEWAQGISLPAVRANLAVSKAISSPTVTVQNPVPTIYFSQSPAVLVLINGAPAWRPVVGTNLLRAINTQALLLLDQASGLYYLRINGGWSQAAGIEGPWADAQNPPGSLATALTNLPDSMELFNPPEGAPPAPTPVIFVSTGQAELITTQGAPQFAPVAGTQLLRVSNSSSSIFMNVTNQNYYVVISGRWFSSPALSGPWQYVSSAQLPPDFANIPETDPAGAVLASVAGTPQAGEAAISSTIPQTASIPRTTATTVTYDGDPVFAPIKGTSLSYATNTGTPVIQVSADAVYAVINGVWFVATSAAGPWTVADDVPDVIYTIPPSSPVFYATNVFVYGSTPDVVYTGYTPGYFGPCLSPEGVVVFGTGFWYPPYIGQDLWIGPPLTYGFGAGFACGLTTGFAFGIAADHGWACSPWWGPWRGGWGSGNNVNRNWNSVNVNNRNVYNRWSNNAINRPAVQNTVNNDANKIRANANAQNWKTSPAAAVDRQTLQNDATRLGDNNVFAGKDGNVYRPASDGGWQQHNGSDWSNAGQSFNSGMRSDLDSQRFSRSVGGMRSGGGGRR